MKADLIADLWNVVVEHITDKNKKDVAYDYINTLLDYGIKESTLEELQGIDPFLDEAIEYAIDGEDIDDYDDYNDDDED